MPSGHKILESSGPLMINDAAAFILREIAKDALSVDDIILKTAGEYDIEAEKIRPDLEKLLDFYLQNGVAVISA